MPSEPSPAHPLGGSSLFGGVRFEVTAPFSVGQSLSLLPLPQALGCLWRNTGPRPRERSRLLVGEELIRTFRPDDGRVKAFCSVCGSSLVGGEWPAGDEIAIRLGSLDGDPAIRPQSHTFVTSRAPWDVVPDDDLPRYDEGYR